MELYTPLNTFTPSDALCITITHTQPCIRPWVDFYVHVNVGRRSSRWQLNSRDAPPPSWGPLFVRADRRRSDRGEMSGNPRSVLRFLGAVKRFVQIIQIWRSFPCSALQRGLCVSVWITSPSIFLIKADVVFSLGPWCHQKLHATVLNFSVVTNQGKRGPNQLLWKRQETGVEKIEMGVERGEWDEMSWKEGWPPFKRGWVIEVLGQHERLR